MKITIGKEAAALIIDPKKGIQVTVPKASDPDDVVPDHVLIITTLAMLLSKGDKALSRLINKFVKQEFKD
jgi:hypothetical protein